MSKREIVLGNKTATAAITDEIRNSSERSDLCLIFKIFYNSKDYYIRPVRIINTDTNLHKME